MHCNIRAASSKHTASRLKCTYFLWNTAKVDLHRIKFVWKKWKCVRCGVNDCRILPRHNFLTQVPPSLLHSTNAAFAPSDAAFRAHARPPEPPPITSKSNAARLVILLTAIILILFSLHHYLFPRPNAMAVGKLLLGTGVLLLTHAALSAVQRTHVLDTYACTATPQSCICLHSFWCALLSFYRSLVSKAYWRRLYWTPHRRKCAVLNSVWHTRHIPDINGVSAWGIAKYSWCGLVNERIQRYPSDNGAEFTVRPWRMGVLLTFHIKLHSTLEIEGNKQNFMTFNHRGRIVHQFVSKNL